MLIIGCDYHPGFQQIAFVDTDTGELGERHLVHREQAEQFAMRRGRKIAKVAMAGNWRCICTGCGAKAMTTANCKSSVRTRESPDIPMVGSKSPT